MLNIKNLIVKIDAKPLPILEIPTLAIDKSEFVAIVGKNGAGKSTFFKCLNKQILFQGEVSTEHDPALLSQNPAHSLFTSLTVLENLKLAGLKKAHSGYLDSFQLGHLTLDQTVSELSGGQQQALALAMIFVKKPQFLLLDEHTSALDVDAAKKIMDLTKEKARQFQTTIIAITHDLKQALDYSDRILVFKKGKIVTERTPEQLNTEHELSDLL